MPWVALSRQKFSTTLSEINQRMMSAVTDGSLDVRKSLKNNVMIVKWRVRRYSSKRATTC